MLHQAIASQSACKAEIALRQIDCRWHEQRSAAASVFCYFYLFYIFFFATTFDVFFFISFRHSVRVADADMSAIYILYLHRSAAIVDL